VVTEYGAVNLHGRTIRERGELLISIAHPDFQAELGQVLRGRVVA
jgi:acyl-CoA hydrolase